MLDYIVDSRSNEEVRALALDALRELKVDAHRQIDVFGILTAGTIMTVFGPKRLVYEEMSDLEMESDDGRTVYAKRTVTIELKKSVAEAARSGSARARMTVAHELGHAFLHQGRTLYRKTAEPTRPAFIPPACSAEHQAKVFAASFLMPEALVQRCNSAAEIALKCLVSFQAAEIRFELLDRLKRRRDNARRMSLLSKELRTENTSQFAIKYLPDPCPSALSHSAGST
ncbi:MAG: ImmA/IrrE family metallo-endopeptidase [Janthinobacterium lividum]